MKQEMISYLYTIKDDIFKLSKFLYDNPEESFCEYKSYNYIVNMLKEYSFKVTENYLDIPTSFYAEYGNGHPKICFICEYDAASKEGHITGHNLISAMSVGAALSLTKVMDKFNSGTIIILGCPGEFMSSSKITMARQGTFKDIDTVLVVHPDVENAETGTSMALLPIKLKYSSKETSSTLLKGTYSSLDACSFTYNSLVALSKGFGENCYLDNISIKHCNSSLTPLNEAELSLYIRAPKMIQACEIDKRIKEFSKAVEILMNVNCEVSMSELPYEELIPNNALSRIFIHNLKEIGIIDTVSPKNTFLSLSLGTVSHIVPCLHHYIKITEDNTINYFTKEFFKATLSSYAEDIVLKTSTALACTALDLLEKEDLIKEIKVEFYESIKDHQDKPCELN